MLFGCCTSSQNASLVKAMGYDFIEVEGKELAAEGAESDFIAAQKRLETAGLPVRGFNKFFTPGIVFTGPTVDTERNRKYIEVSFARAKALGGQNIGWGSATSRKVPEGFPKEKALDQMRDALALMADVAARHGMNVLMESINRKNEVLILTIKDATDLARSAGRPNAHVVADIFHMLSNDDPLENMAVAGKDLYHVHFTDLDRRAPGSDPGQRHIYEKSFQVLRQMGYDRSVSIEPDFVVFEHEARRALGFLKDAYAQVRKG